MDFLKDKQIIKKHDGSHNELKNEFSVLRSIISERFGSSLDSLLYVRVLLNILCNIYLFQFKYFQSLTMVKVHFGYQKLSKTNNLNKVFCRKTSTCFQVLNFYFSSTKLPL